MSTDLQHWLERDGEQFLRTVGVAQGAVVVDFGCRCGSYAIPAARVVGPGGRVYAVDKNEDALNELRQRAAAHGLGNLCYINTRGEVALPLETGAADAVLLYDVIHLIGWSEGEGAPSRRSTAADRRRLLEEMHRIAKPDALLSVYLQHLDTHTDATSEEQVRGEIEACGVRFREDLHLTLVHDEKLLRGHVLNFNRVERNVTPPGSTDQHVHLRRPAARRLPDGAGCAARTEGS